MPPVDPFVLSVNHKPDGYTHITYDVGVDKRLVATVPTENAHSTLDLPASHVTALLLSRNKVPPVVVI